MSCIVDSIKISPIYIKWFLNCMKLNSEVSKAMLRFHTIGYFSCTSPNPLTFALLISHKFAEFQVFFFFFFFQVLVCNSNMIGFQIAFDVFCE